MLLLYICLAHSVCWLCPLLDAKSSTQWNSACRNMYLCLMLPCCCRRWMCILLSWENLRFFLIKWRLPNVKSFYFCALMTPSLLIDLDGKQAQFKNKKLNFRTVPLTGKIAAEEMNMLAEFLACWPMLAKMQ